MTLHITPHKNHLLVGNIHKFSTLTLDEQNLPHDDLEGIKDDSPNYGDPEMKEEL